MEHKLDSTFSSMLLMFFIMFMMHVFSRTTDNRHYHDLKDQLVRIENHLNVAEFTVDALAHDYMVNAKRIRATEDKGRVPDGPRSYTEIKQQITEPVIFKNKP